MRAKQIFSGGTIISIGAGGTQIFNAHGGPMVIGSGKGIVQTRDLAGSFDCLEVTGSAGIDVTRGDPPARLRRCDRQGQSQDSRRQGRRLWRHRFRRLALSFAN